MARPKPGSTWLLTASTAAAIRWSTGRATCRKRCTQFGPLDMGRALVGGTRRRANARVLDAGKGLRRLSRADGQTGSSPRTRGTPAPRAAWHLDAMLETYTFSGALLVAGPRLRWRSGAVDVQATVGRWLDGQFSPGHAALRR